MHGVRYHSFFFFSLNICSVSRKLLKWKGLEEAQIISVEMSGRHGKCGVKEAREYNESRDQDNYGLKSWV